MAAPTDQEQLLLELINEARLNPLKSASRLITSYGPLTSSDRDIQAALTSYGVSGADLQRAFSGLMPTNPLAWNDALGTAAERHSAAMIASDTQSHQVPGEGDLLSRLQAAGYTPRAAGENVYGYAASPMHAHGAFMIDWGSGPGGMQDPAGHRNAIMSGGYNEIGIDMTRVPTGARDLGPYVVTQDFASRGKHFILGVAYNDSDKNQFYSLGEGRGDLVVQLAGKSVTSAASGGYTMEAPDGPGAITLTGGGLAGAVSVKTIGASVNLKLDVVNGNTLLTSGSISVEGPITELRGLGTWGLTLTAGAGDQTIIGTEDRDELNGGAGNDTLKGLSGLNVLNGGTGDDILEGGIDNDTLNGGEGTDTAVFTGNRSLYTVTAVNGGVKFVSARSGTDIAKDVEIFRFADGNYVWNASSGSLTAQSQANRGPTITGTQSGTGEEDKALTFTVVASDPDGDPLTYSVINPANGTLTAGANGVYMYTPKANFNGSDSFTVSVTDNKGATATYSAAFSIAAVNDAPTGAASQSLSVVSGASKPITVAASDVDNDTLSFAATAASHGTVSGGANGIFTYKPTAGYIGNDSFTVNVSDGKGGTFAQVINLQVTQTATQSAGFQTFTSSGLAATVGGTTTVFGSSGLQDITVADGPGAITFDVAFNRGGDIVRLPGTANEFQIHLEASAVVLEKDGLDITIPIGDVGIPLVFEDGTRTLVYDSAAASVRVGNQVIGATPATITAPASAVALPTGLDPDAVGRAFLTEGAKVTLGGDLNVFGTSGAEDITFVSGHLVLDPTFNRGGDTIHLPDGPEGYTAQLDGSVVVLKSGADELTLPIGPNGLVLDFDGDKRTFVLDQTSQSVRIGDQAITASPVQLGDGQPGSGSGISLDIGRPAVSALLELDTSKSFVLNDDASNAGFANVKGFGRDDVIHVTNARAGDYNFGTGDADGDGRFDDLLLSYSNNGTPNLTALLDVVSPGAFVYNEATAEKALGWDFITFG